MCEGDSAEGDAGHPVWNPCLHHLRIAARAEKLDRPNMLGLNEVSDSTGPAELLDRLPLGLGIGLDAAEFTGKCESIVAGLSQPAEMLAWQKSAAVGLTGPLLETLTQARPGSGVNCDV